MRAAHPAGLRGPAAELPRALLPVLTQAKVGGQCVWEFGNMTNGKTFGRDHQYAHLVAHGFF